ncbi:hypothetical protein ACJX0J_021305, partial [Zea mays]
MKSLASLDLKSAQRQQIKSNSLAKRRAKKFLCSFFYDTNMFAAASEEMTI